MVSKQNEECSYHTHTLIINKKDGRKLLEVTDMFMAHTAVVFHRYKLIFKLINLYTLNMYSFVYGCNTSINWLKYIHT